MPRVVLDTNVLVAALRSRRGASFEIISRLGTGAFDAAVSVSLVLEYESALLRHMPASPYSEREIRDFIDYVCQASIRQKIFFLWRPFLRDPSDDLVLEVAVAAGCEAIVTHNVRDFTASQKLGVRALTHGEFLRKIRRPKWVH